MFFPYIVSVSLFIHLRATCNPCVHHQHHTHLLPLCTKLNSHTHIRQSKPLWIFSNHTTTHTLCSSLFARQLFRREPRGRCENPSMENNSSVLSPWRICRKCIKHRLALLVVYLNALVTVEPEMHYIHFHFRRVYMRQAQCIITLQSIVQSGQKVPFLFVNKITFKWYKQLLSNFLWLAYRDQHF